MKYAAVLLVAFACSCAFASEPGQPLDCSDWVFFEPGLSCHVVIEECSQGYDGYICQNVAGRPADGDGSILSIRTRSIGVTTCPSGNTNSFNTRIEVSRMRDGVRSVIAALSPRCGPDNTVDFVQTAGPDDGHAGFDANYGRLFLGVITVCDAQGSSGCLYPGRNPLIVIEGFSTTFEVLQTYTPSAALGFRVPYMPEGLSGADHFDTYWGNLTHPLDFTQAHALQCGYPAAAPHVGDYLTVADAVPTPPPGQGVYYVTAATYQNATRYGLQTMHHQTTGRDPALLPACTP